MKEITIIRPDDFHLHLRQGSALASVVNHSAREFARAIVMPNLKTPVITVQQALSYRQQILDCLSDGNSFNPLMTLYLTDNTKPEQIHQLAENEFIMAVKYYPAGATTNSDQGVTSIEKTFSVLKAMSELKVPLLVHGEVTDNEVDIFDREIVFIERILSPLMERFPDLRIVFEHITTEQAANYVKQGPENLAATITPQHLMYNRNKIFERGIRPHHYCLPVINSESHRQALVAAAISGDTHFFLGTDSAPHARNAKESACGCAGIYSAYSAIELYAEVFEQAGAIQQLEQFASINGATFYGLPKNKEKIVIRKQEWEIPSTLPFSDSEIVPLKAGQTCQWRLLSDD